MTDVPRIESVFGKAEIAEMRARFAEEAKARAAQVTTEASRTLLARSRTVIDKDRETLTVVDGDVLDHAKSIEAEAAASVRAALGDIIRTWDAAMVALIVSNDHGPVPEFLPVADAIKAARAILDAATEPNRYPHQRDRGSSR